MSIIKASAGLYILYLANAFLGTYILGYIQPGSWFNPFDDLSEPMWFGNLSKGLRFIVSYILCFVVILLATLILKF